MKTKIQIKSLLGKVISTRQHIDILRKKLRTLNNSEIILDFTGVEFISRSFADELLKLQKENIDKHQLKIKFENLEYSVTKMIAVVKKGYKNKRKNLIPITKVSKLEEITCNF